MQLANLNLALEMLLVIGLTAGAYLARRGRIGAHRVNQTIWVLVNAGLVVFIMFPSLMENAQITKASELANVPIAIAWLHATAGSLTVIAGLWLVLQMNNILPAALHITWWKKLMRLTLAGYWMVAIGGICVYYFWHK